MTLVKCPSALALLLLSVHLGAQEPSPGLYKEQLGFQGQRYTYYVFNPQGRDDAHPLPALLLLHGAGGDGMDLLSAWKEFARRNEIILIAPNLPRKPEFEDICPEFFKRLVDTVESQMKVDPQRVYVFGHSMGGYLAFDAAMLDSDIFAAIAVHASFIAPDYVGIVDRATRKLPIALYGGGQDQMVPIARVRGTRDLLQAHGFPLHYVEIPEHDHNYSAFSERINADAWEFLHKQRLDGRE